MALTRARELLANHLAGPLAADEAEMTRSALDFMAAHEDCLARSCLQGHLTGSAWIVDPARERTLLLLHRKLGRWLQPGGHADGDGDLSGVALREVREETGLGPGQVKLVSPELFDFDRHRIPARGAEPDHWHFDFRFLVEADPKTPLQLSSESHELRWFELASVATVAPEPSIRRLVAKTRGSRVDS